MGDTVAAQLVGHEPHGARRQSGQRRRGIQMSQSEQDSGKTYADMWGEAVHSNRHLRVLSMGLAGLVLLLVVIIVRLSSVELPKPIVVRVDEVGRAEALAYDAVEAQADPLDPTTKYFLNRFIDDYYSRRGATVLETENGRLKKLLAESQLEIEVTREVLQKKW